MIWSPVIPLLYIVRHREVFSTLLGPQWARLGDEVLGNRVFRPPKRDCSSEPPFLLACVVRRKQSPLQEKNRKKNYSCCHLKKKKRSEAEGNAVVLDKYFSDNHQRAVLTAPQDRPPRLASRTISHGTDVIARERCRRGSSGKRRQSELARARHGHERHGGSTMQCRKEASSPHKR